MVLHYSQLLSADPSSPTLPEYKTPYDFHRCDPLSEANGIPSEDQDTITSHIDDDDRVSLGDDGSDTNSLEGVDHLISPSESATSVTTLPAQWESSKYDHKWQVTDPNLEQDGHFKGTDTIYEFSDHRGVLQILYKQFGFTIGHSAPEISRDEWMSCQKWLGHYQPEYLPSDQCASVYQFVVSLITNQNNLTALQQIADYDISHNATLPLINQREAGFIILLNRLNDGSVCYIIDTNSQYSTDQWSILLTDPMTVVQCMHMHFNGSLKNMARYLYYSGIPFNTCILCDVPEVQDVPYRPLSLGWRPKEHAPTTEDYGEYQATLDRLFSQPYARAALLEGGLIWCIALLYLSDGVLEVTEGPSFDTSSLGRYWKLAENSTLYDDKLSNAEIDVICGVYEIATGE